MNFIGLHSSAATSLATSAYLLSADEVSCCESAVQLLERLQDLVDHRAAELAAATAQASADGYAEGCATGLRELPAQWLAVIERATEQAQLDRHELRDAVIALSRHIVQRIAATMAPSDVVSALVLRAIESLTTTPTAVLNVHPSVVKAVREQLAMHGKPHLVAAIDVNADPALDLLDCRFETATGQLLAGLATQLDNITAALRHSALPATRLLKQAVR